LPGGGNWKPIPQDDGPKVFVQKGSKMNDMNFDEETPF
jgi:replicative DNA helicase